MVLETHSNANKFGLLQRKIICFDKQIDVLAIIAVLYLESTKIIALVLKSREHFKIWELSHIQYNHLDYIEHSLLCSYAELINFGYLLNNCPVEIFQIN